MKDGFIQQVGTPQEVFDQPHNLFVAGFIGSPQMNFMQAKLTKNGDKFSVSVLGVNVELDEEKCALLKEHGADTMDVILGVRPEHMTVHFNKGEGDIEGTIMVNEMMGSELHLHVNVGLEKNVILRIPTIDLSIEQRNALTAGNKLSFTFTSKVAQIFNPETEMSLLY